MLHATYNIHIRNVCQEDSAEEKISGSGDRTHVKPTLWGLCLNHSTIPHQCSTIYSVHK